MSSYRPRHLRSSEGGGAGTAIAPRRLRGPRPAQMQKPAMAARPATDVVENSLVTPAVEPAQESPSRGVLRGLSWGTVGQVASVAVSLGLTPFLLARLGASAYGVVALTASLMGLLSNVDAGINPSCDRYLPVFFGAGDRRRMASFLLTAVVLLGLVQALVAGTVALLAPTVVGILHGPGFDPAQAVWYLRAFMVLVVVSAWQGLLVKVLRAEGRWRYLNIVGTGAALAYAVVAATLVGLGWGLRGVFVAAAVQQAVAVIGFGIPALKILELRGCRPFGRQDVGAIVHFGLRAQVAELASSVGYELNTLTVAALFPVSDVAFFTIGSNFSAALVSLPVNAVTPMSTALGRAFGSGSLARTVEEFKSLQTRWLQAVAAFPLVGAIAAYYGVSAWLGPHDHLAAEVAVVLLVGQWVTIMCVMIDVLGKVANQPGLESRYLSLGAVVNVALTVPLALTIGIIGIPIGIAVSQAVSAALCVRLVGRRVYSGVSQTFAAVRKGAVLSACLVTLVLELVIRPWVPRGPLGLCACALPALAGLGIYALGVIGPRRAGTVAKAMWRRDMALAMAVGAGAGGSGRR